ncbi:hypothetical protein NDU88_001922 [Pleurodeles waltl]|uniref:Uncharacterized protein n=1 Tax=Pleurodeles waltl TaxID=8319 RepID=A0AAV7TKJ4_PLEWA|nr:hypothetical protein NDU88_001922 [Pleurodeles waltl]
MRCTAEVGPTLTSRGDRGRGARPWPQETLWHEEDDGSGLAHCADRDHLVWGGVTRHPAPGLRFTWDSRGLGGPEQPAEGDTSTMVRTKGRLLQQTNKMDNYAVSRRPGNPGVHGGRQVDGRTLDRAGPLSPPEASLSDIMAAIHHLKGSLEPQLDAVDVGLLRADLQKVSDTVSTAETDIACLQSTSKALEEQVRFLTAEHGRIAVRLEDQEGQVRRNNFRVVGVPGGAEGPSVELFVETLITDHLCLKRLSSFFKAEWAPRAPVPPL